MLGIKVPQKTVLSANYSVHITKKRIQFWMLNLFRLEILNPKVLESSIVYARQCSSVIESPAVVTVSLSKANPTFSYLMVKTVLQFFAFHVECKYNTGINIFVYYWGCHLGQAFGRAITKVTFGYFRSSWKPTSFPGRSVGTGTREPWEQGWLKAQWKCPKCQIICPPPPPFKIQRQPGYNTLVHSLKAVFCTATSKLMR